ncbi:uncharacterized protein LOC142221551 [Haematobia irritans]|uniref:uncharacterized protein LOC142221551 n=1 Tax=Haematobia irritans TaxID=7368 RepID=UPI003F503FE1
MNPLHRFIRANDKLVQFEEQMTDTLIATSTTFALEVHREELKAMWGTIKGLYEKCTEALLTREDDDKKEKEKGDKNQGGEESTDSETDSDLNMVNSRYYNSYEAYVRIVSKISASIQMRSQAPNCNSQSSSSNSSFHLPPCDTESFKGDYHSWPTFRDMFSAVYIQNANLSNVQKLFHLRKKTEGEAHEIVKSCPLTNSGFDIAWQNLKERFENKRMLVHSQLKILFNLPAVCSESSEDIKNLRRDINSCISCLRLYDIEISNWDPIFVYICSTKLPRVTLSLWEQSVEDKKDISKWSDLNAFLSSRYQTLETVSEVKGSSNSNKLGPSNSTVTKHSNYLKKVNSHHTRVSVPPFDYPCKLCINEIHPIRKCPKFLQMNHDERRNSIKKLGLCINCFAGTHTIKDCKSSFNCSLCHQRHNTLIHRDEKKSDKQKPYPKPRDTMRAQSRSHSELQSTNPNVIVNVPEPSTSGKSIQTCFASNSQNVLLGTAVVQINHMGLKYFVRVLIDSGSHGTFITERIFHILKLPSRPIDAEISGLNGITSAKARKIATFSVSPRCESNLEISIDALVVPKLSENLPSNSINPSLLKEFPDINLADPKFYTSSRIDMLIGADIFNKILLDNVKRNICGSLIAQETIFGWIVTGPIQNDQISSFSNIVSFFTECTLEKQLERFWEVENFPQKPLLSHSDILCEKLYSETTERDKDGRYVVSLPFKQSFYENSKMLGQSRSIAYAQFLKNEYRLSKDVGLRDKYNSILEEYIELGHMEHVAPPSMAEFPKHFYLPHHAVFKPESTTTKIRVVFNASCRTSSGTSLNDVLYSGPILQNDVTILILRWRFFRFVFNADIEKMYRQIRVHPKDTPFQRILFRSCDDATMQDYELKTVTFGVNAAPYLAIRTLLQLANDVKDTFPLAKRIIEESMYVDDVLAGCHEVNSCISARDQLISALKSAGFPLRKWASNCPELLKDIPRSHLLKDDFLCFHDTSQAKTLGIKWNAKSDNFFFESKPFSNNSNFSKREVLSEIAKIYDPAGWLAPIVVLAKILMRKIWLSKVGWDEFITTECLVEWKKFLKSYSIIESIKLPRWISYSPRCEIQFHAFCDASENAYAVAIYTRVKLDDTHIIVRLLTSKTRVSPVKSISIPKLELCGAALLSEVVKSVIPSMQISAYEVFKWTDSTIVLSRLQQPPCHWKVFVANRISTIANNVGTDNWFHVDSKSNPADLASRGVYPQELKVSRLWWEGPEWLQKHSNFWPNQPSLNLNTDLEKRNTLVHSAFISNYADILERFSSFNRAIQVICYIFRFLHRGLTKYRSTHVYRSIDLTSLEVNFVKIRLIILAQRASFPDEYKALLDNNDIKRSSHILNLNPFLDKDGIIRANGRLACSSLTYNEKFPIVLPYSCQFSRLLIHFTHVLSLHGGNQLIVRLIRSQFWIPKLKNLAKTIINKCKVCTIYKRKTKSQIMAALPPERTTISRPFHCTGIDFAGPFDVKSSSVRGCKSSKSYACIFVCFETRAIHLEATSSLSTATFLAAFHRFISRRGCPLHIYSDNGTNFVGASKDIARDFLSASRSNLISQMVHQNLSWHFIPPGAPHMGGLWEAGVRSFKTHFKKVSGSHKYTFEEFCTLLARIEGCLNSRPISIMSEDPTDLNPLTPGHFLTGGPILTPPEPTIDTHPETVTNRWQRVKALHHHFCQRWKVEYLRELHKRNKWKFPEMNVEVNSIVIIPEDNLSPNEWRIGRVVRVYPGKDNRVRVADVFTQRGTITRPIVKLVCLPTD